MAWPALKTPHMGQEAFRKRIADIPRPYWLRGITVHNTAAPSMKHWLDAVAKYDKPHGLTPGTTRIRNLENYFRGEGWRGGPHLFMAPPCGGMEFGIFWELNDFRKQGTHSPSVNLTHFGIEMVADFSREDDDSGLGLKVRQDTIFACAVMCDEWGLDPRKDLMMHKHDPKTNHDCPGKDFAEDWNDILREIEALASGNVEQDEDRAGIAAVIANGEAVVKNEVERVGIVDVIEGDTLNVREGPGMSFKAVTTLSRGQKITVLGQPAKNGSTGWLKIRTPMGYEPYWVAGRYIKEG